MRNREFNDTTNRQANIGLCILRIFMCFEVVLCHFWIPEEVGKPLIIFEKLKLLAVPCFMFMSFVLTGNSIILIKKERFLKRLYRLIVPQVVWTGIYWGIYKELDIKFDLGLEHGIPDLIYQVFLGHSINQTMWYQVNLIIITMFFGVLFYLLKEKKCITIVWIILAISLILQYSGINVALFAELNNKIKFPLGRVCEMIPYAALGLIFSHYRLLEKMEKYRMYIICIFSFFTLFLLTYRVFATPEGYHYSGIYGICMAILLVTIFYLIPFGKLPKKVNIIIEFISKYTLGIYCMHRLIRTLLVQFIYGRFNLQQGTFEECILLFGVCYVVAFGVSKLPFKWCKDIVV